MKTDITNTLFLTKTTPRMVLGTTHNRRKKCKLVSLVRPARLPLPFSYCSVEVLPTATGVDVLDPDTGRDILHLDCDFDAFEECWAELLPVFSAAYLEGDTDGRTVQEERP